MPKKKKKKKITMNDEIASFPVYLLTNKGRLTEIPLASTQEYNHSKMHLHHFIKKSDYYKKKQWYIDHNIDQKLILLPIHIHEQVHQQAIDNLSDFDFTWKFGISRWKLIFNEKHSQY